MKIQIKQTLVQAESINQFRGTSGRRRANMPYWVRTKDGNYVFDFIGPHTDPILLNDQIKKGIVYLREKDV